MVKLVTLHACRRLHYAHLFPKRTAHGTFKSFKDFAIELGPRCNLALKRLTKFKRKSAKNVKRDGQQLS